MEDQKSLTRTRCVVCALAAGKSCRCVIRVLPHPSHLSFKRVFFASVYMNICSQHQSYHLRYNHAKGHEEQFVVFPGLEAHRIWPDLDSQA